MRNIIIFSFCFSILISLSSHSMEAPITLKDLQEAWNQKKDVPRHFDIVYPYILDHLKNRFPLEKNLQCDIALRPPLNQLCRLGPGRSLSLDIYPLFITGLLDLGAPIICPKIRKESADEHALMDAIASDNLIAVETICAWLKKRNQLNYINFLWSYNSQTLLFTAVGNIGEHTIDIIKTLLAHGAKVNIPIKYNRDETFTALTRTIVCCEEETMLKCCAIIQILVDAGADLHFKSLQGNTAFSMAKHNPTIRDLLKHIDQQRKITLADFAQLRSDNSSFVSHLPKELIHATGQFICHTQEVIL